MTCAMTCDKEDGGRAEGEGSGSVGMAEGKRGAKGYRERREGRGGGIVNNYSSGPSTCIVCNRPRPEAIYE